MIVVCRWRAELYGEADGTIQATFQVIYMIGWAPHESQPKPKRRGSGQVRGGPHIVDSDNSEVAGSINHGNFCTARRFRRRVVEFIRFFWTLHVSELCGYRSFDSNNRALESFESDLVRSRSTSLILIIEIYCSKSLELSAYVPSAQVTILRCFDCNSVCPHCTRDPESHEVRQFCFPLRSQSMHRAPRGARF